MGNSDDRRSARANVLMTAEIELGASRIPVRIVNVSAHGALVAGNSIPAGEAPVVFSSNGIAVPGWLIWSQGDFAGIQFDEVIHLEDLTRKAGAPRIVITPDSRTGNTRRPGFRGNQLTDEERTVVAEWKRLCREADPR